MEQTINIIKFVTIMTSEIIKFGYQISVLTKQIKPDNSFVSLFSLVTTYIEF